MRSCPDCGQPTTTANRCEACEAVEFAFTPRGSRVIKPARHAPPVAFPVIVPAHDPPPEPRTRLWAAIALALLVLVLGALYALRVG